MTSMPSLTLTLVDGTRVVVPDSLNLITPYVLQEQQDWFEDEIKFLRHLLRPGQKVIDIGANYGVYTLSMARAIGPGGQVWCFEPASSTADWLAQGIAANGFSHVTLDRRALSSAPGTAHLTLNDNAELNELVRGAGAPGGKTEEVPLTTLDACLAQYGWQDIDFMKVDAEGEESNILKGGQKFFDTLSPLVEFEVKAGQSLHLDLVQQFADLGYRSYRLVPGLQLLTPFDPAQPPDGYLLNLFCCKSDRAALLAEQGFLVDPATAGTEDKGEALLAAAAAPRYQWEQTLARLSYAGSLLPHWQDAMKGPDAAIVARVLALHALSHDPQQPAVRRFNALDLAMRLMVDLCGRQASFLRPATLARLATEYGARSAAVEALTFLANTISQQKTVNPGEPFLTPGAQQEQQDPGQKLPEWIFSCALEEHERQSAFSSFYSGNSSRERLQAINGLGFASPEMQRRLALLRKRMG